MHLADSALVCSPDRWPEATFRRLLNLAGGDGLDTIIGAWMWLCTSIIGGKRVIASTVRH